MFRIDVFLLMFVSMMPRLFRDFISSPLNRHVNLTGRSPLLITHDTDAVSPSFKISSPNSKGVICGGTIAKRILFESGLGFWDNAYYITEKTSGTL